MPRLFRLLRAALLIGFALLIAKLFAKGEMAKYMSPALDPLTALTALALLAMGLMELRGGATGEHHHAADATEQALTGLLLLLPILLGLFLVPRSLGLSALGGESINSLLLSFGSGPPPGVRAAPPPPARPIQDVG